MACNTRARVSAWTQGSSLITRDTVFTETPAASATSRIVTDTLSPSIPIRHRSAAHRLHARLGVCNRVVATVYLPRYAHDTRDAAPLLTCRCNTAWSD